MSDFKYYLQTLDLYVKVLSNDSLIKELIEDLRLSRKFSDSLLLPDGQEKRTVDRKGGTASSITNSLTGDGTSEILCVFENTQFKQKITPFFFKR